MIYPTRAFYRPGEIVVIKTPGSYQATIWHLADVVASLEGTDTLEWLPPPLPKRGYRVRIEMGDKVMWTAFDVLEQWTEAPRYGFLFDFHPNRKNYSLDFVLAHHVNGIQFYDWMYRHDTILPPTDEFEDPLGRKLSLDTIKHLIADAHEKGMAAMPYTAIYAASPEFASQHPDWGLYDEQGTLYDFADGFLKIMNPASEWRKHFVQQCQSILESLPFDGIHVDQYGEPQTGYTKEAEEIDLPLAFVDSLKSIHNVIPANKALLFNLVHNWPLNAIAETPVNFLYCEIWPPKTTLGDLSEVVQLNRQAASGKTPVVAVYINPEHEHTAKLVEAVIHASGGYHIVHGENGLYLSDPYFPKSVHPSEELSQYLKKVADFGVAYEELLSFANPLEVDAEFPPDLWLIARQTENTLSLNLLNTSPEYLWNEEVNKHLYKQDVQIKMCLDQSVEQIWYVTPDEAQAPRFLEYNQQESHLQFTIPEIKIWMMVCIEFAE